MPSATASMIGFPARYIRVLMTSETAQLSLWRNACIASTSPATCWKRLPMCGQC